MTVLQMYVLDKLWYGPKRCSCQDDNAHDLMIARMHATAAWCICIWQSIENRIHPLQLLVGQRWRSSICIGGSSWVAKVLPFPKWILWILNSHSNWTRARYDSTLQIMMYIGGAIHVFKFNETHCMSFLSQNLHLLKTRLSADKAPQLFLIYILSKITNE